MRLYAPVRGKKTAGLFCPPQKSFVSRATARSFDRVSEWGDCGEVVSRRVFRVPVPRVGLSTGVQQSGFAIIDGKIDGKIDSSSTAVSHEQRRLFCLKSGVRLLGLGGS